MPQKWKGGRKEAQKRYRKNNREKIRERDRKWYQGNRDRELKKRGQYLDKHREHIYKQNAASQKKSRKEYKERVIKGYGSACICCGETESLFLEIHHPEGDGKADRERTGGNSLTLYRWITDNNFPKNYDLLCANCHKGIHYSEDRICPHKMRSP